MGRRLRIKAICSTSDGHHSMSSGLTDRDVSGAVGEFFHVRTLNIERGAWGASADCQGILAQGLALYVMAER